MSIAAATLVVAALFRPARDRLQIAVDRRFNRTRYDAALVAERFSRRLRDEIDLVALIDGLGAAARRATQPVALSLWIREPA